jgi:hypothetical protein
MAAARMAQLAKQPVGTVKIHEQVGQLVKIDYTLLGKYRGSPDIVLPMKHDPIVDDALFWFQGTRIKNLSRYEEHFGIPFYSDEQTWYANVMEKAKALVKVLPRLDLSEGEALFFMQWVSNICAYGLNYYERR